jgi:hypothetical protein
MKKSKKQVATRTGVALCGAVLAGVIGMMTWADDVPFTDVSQDAWYYSAVATAYQEKLMVGIGDNKFAPTGNLTREQFVTILANIADADVSNYSTLTTPFSDISSTAWYAPYIQWAYDNGYVNGYGNGKFGVGDAVTREQMAQFIANYCKVNNITLPTNVVNDFTDESSIHAWAKSAVDMCHAAGIFNGDENGKMNPSSTASRAETATVAVNLYEILESSSNNGDTELPDDSKDGHYVNDNYDRVMGDLDSMWENGFFDDLNNSTFPSFGTVDADKDNTGDADETTPVTPPVAPDTDEDKDASTDTDVDAIPDVDGSVAPDEGENEDKVVGEESGKDTETPPAESTDPSDGEDAVVACEHQYEITGYVLPDGSEMYTGGYTPFQITANQNNTYLFVVGSGR